MYGFLWFGAGLGWYRLVLLRCVLFKLVLGCLVVVVWGMSRLVSLRFGEGLSWSLCVLLSFVLFLVGLCWSWLVPLRFVWFCAGLGWSRCVLCGLELGSVGRFVWFWVGLSWSRFGLYLRFVFLLGRSRLVSLRFVWIHLWFGVVLCCLLACAGLTALVLVLARSSAARANILVEWML